jgi:hypothetical protein
MEKRKRPLHLLVLSILTFIVLVFVFFFIPPSSAIQIGIPINILLFVFPLLFILFYSLLSFLFRKKSHGVIVGALLVLYLLLRLGGFTHPLFFLILLALLLILELLFSKEK